MNPGGEHAGGGIHWEIDGVLACSERPGFPNHTVPARVVDQWLEELRRQGVRSVINMLSEEEMAVYYRHLEQPLVEYCADAGFEVRQVSHEDLGVIVTKSVLLDRVHAAFNNLPKPVIIHCSAGAERSKLAVKAICKMWKRRNKKRSRQQC
jgi:hypothetical protein